MARRTTNTTPESTTSTSSEAATPIKRRRRRRVVDHAAQTAILVESLLKTRAGRGATQQELISVIEWARAVHAEAEALRILAGRPRRAKTEAPTDRVARFEVNKTLLDGVLGGTLGIDVDEAGNIVFLTLGDE